MTVPISFMVEMINIAVFITVHKKSLRNSFTGFFGDFYIFV